MTDHHLNAQQLSERWQMSPDTIDRWRQRGRGPLFLKIGGKVLYRLSDVEAFEAANVMRTTSKDPGIATDE